MRNVPENQIRGDEEYEKVALEIEGFKLVLSNLGDEPKYSKIRKEFRDRDTCLNCRKELHPSAKYGICTKCQGDSDVEVSKFKKHPCDWIATVAPPGYSPSDVREDIHDFFFITQTLVEWTEDAGTEEENTNRRDVFDSFVHDYIEDEIPGKIPDSTALQKVVVGDSEELDGPFSNGVDDILNRATATVDSVFPAEDYRDERLSISMDIADNDKNSYNVPLRIVAGLYYLGLACEEANRGDRWYITHKMAEGKSPRAAGAYMTLGHYVMFRYTDAPQQAVRMTVK